MLDTDRVPIWGAAGSEQEQQQWMGCAKHGSKDSRGLAAADSGVARFRDVTSDNGYYVNFHVPEKGRRSGPAAKRCPTGG